MYERSIECVLIGYDPNSKAYRCYDRSARKVYSSYHVRFIESQNDSKPLPGTNAPANDSPSMSSIAKSSSHIPTSHPQDDDNNIPAIPGPILEAIPTQHEPAQEPQVRRSTQIPIPTEKMCTGDRPETHTEKAVRESREAGDRLREVRQERRRDEREPIDAGGTDVTVDPQPDLDQILSALNAIEDLPDLSPEADPETPRSWEDAKNSSDGPKWVQSYQEELTSLKEMGVWKLVPREDVPRGHRILKGRPVFTIKRDETGQITRFKTRHVV